MMIEGDMEIYFLRALDLDLLYFFLNVGER